MFIDSERETWNLDPDALKKAFELYGRPKAVVAVHLYGTPAKLDEISALCAEYGVPLIEDAAEALGSEYKGKKCGTFGKLAALSFNGNKIITTSGGGMLLCTDEADAKHALKLATQAREPFPWYEHEEIGYNYRMSNISAGIGRGQMRVLDERVHRKREIFAAYENAFAGLPLEMSPTLPDTRPNRWLSVALLDAASPETVIAALQSENIEARRVWKPMHMQPVFKANKFVKTSAEPVSDDLFARGVCLPSDTKMTDAELESVIEVVKTAIS